MNSEELHKRYQRQIILREFGLPAQEKLLAAKVLVIGAGGLGCSALQYLAAAGVGHIGIVDYDVIELSNLQRQVLYSEEEIGKPKAEIAAEKIKALNSAIRVEAYNEKLLNKNALDRFAKYDLIIDCSDNFSTRYRVNDACTILNKPMIYGAVLRFEGQVGVFNLVDNLSHKKTNYRDLFPLPPDPASTPSCNEAGVLGVLPGLIGAMQATEAIKIVTGVGNPLCNKIISYNALTNSFYTLEIEPRQKDDSFFPKNKNEFLSFDYEVHCGAGSIDSEISALDFESLRIQENLIIIDVRENDEVPLVNEFGHTKIPLSEFEKSCSAINPRDKIILFCATGQRSARALKILEKHFPKAKAYSLAGGIRAWKQLYKIQN